MILLGISQFLTWPIAFVYFNTLYRLKINGRENLKKVPRPFIIIINHLSFADSFLFRLILGFFTTNLPLRFMALNRFDWRWLNCLANIGVISFIYSIFGVFVVVPGRGIQKNLEEAKRFIGHKQIIVIHPEGKIITHGKVAPFKPGAAVLAIETETPVIPISLHAGSKKCFRKELTVNIGEPIRVSANDKADETTQLFYDTVLEMYNKA